MDFITDEKTMQEDKQQLPQKVVTDNTLANDKQKSMAVIAYLFGFISGLVILLIERKDRFIRFHALQSVITFLSLFILITITELIPVIGPYVGFVVLLFTFYVWLKLIQEAMNHTWYKVPHIGDIVEKQV